jgi:two-component system response regulator YesN
MFSKKESGTMSKILIADRDHTERTGIEWLIKSYRIRFDRIEHAADIHEVIQMIERYTPQVVCIELEMIPQDQWTQVVHLFQNYVGTVVALTTEAVFERALQAIELNAFSLLVKPLSPDRLKHVLYRACSRKTVNHIDPFKKVEDDQTVSYTSLFIDLPLRDHSRSFMLIQPEEPEKTKELLHWLEQYPFSYPVQWFALSDMAACLLTLPQEQEYTLLQQDGHRLLHNWMEQHGGGLNLAIHLSTMSSDSLHQMYLRTKETLKMRFYKGNHQLLWVDEMNQFHSIDPFLTSEEQRVWIQLLEGADKQGVKSWLYESFTQFPNGYPEPDLLRIRLTSILAQLRRFMQTYHLEKESHLEEKYHEVFRSVLYSPILFRIVQEILLFCFELVDGAVKHKQEATTDFVERGLQLIEKNYHITDLSLEDIAESVGRSPSYFSHLLSQKKKKTFRQTLTEVRLKQAKRLLIETDHSVQEIADKVGYTDPNYFSRVFKDLVGISPRAYRQKERKSKEK